VHWKIADTHNFNLFFFLANACKDSWRGGGAKESKGGARDERRAMREEERKLQRERERERHRYNNTFRF